MRKNRSSATSALATIEIDASRLHACVITRHGEAVTKCQSRSLTWRHEATTLHSETGQAEIADALRRISGELKIAGVPTWMSLTGDLCVTRVVTGDDETVRRELAELEQRSTLYLSLGHGPKALAAGVRQIDARHRHALLSVVNQKTLAALVDAAGRAGLQLERIEPSLVSLCRLVGQMQFDAQAPVLVMSVGERGAELGISHRGVLLLDYRPAGTDNQPAQLAETITHHLARLQRYCQRYVRFAAGTLSNIYLSGPPELVGDGPRRPAVDDGCAAGLGAIGGRCAAASRLAELARADAGRRPRAIGKTASPTRLAARGKLACRGAGLGRSLASIDALRIAHQASGEVGSGRPRRPPLTNALHAR
jgi:hypothetical protein